MEVKQLSVLNFKNYEEATIYPDPHVNIFTGLNGQGKTNMLDAIHYLSFCKSYFNPVDSQNIQHGEDFFVVEGVFAQNGESDKIYCGVKRGQKKVFKKNKTEYERLSEHIGSYPSVIISPYDKDLISEGSEMRRKFMDSIISQYNRPYLDDLIAYNKVLKQRNSLLRYFWENRTFDPDNLEVWSTQLIELAEKIHKVRKDFVEAFEPIFLKHYEAISGNAEDVKITYRSHLNDGEFAQVVAESVEKDRRTQY
ncbi:MAG: DNA replication and repair protein RecF, partial [Bacteroidota bacterium]